MLNWHLWTDKQEYYAQMYEKYLEDAERREYEKYTELLDEIARLREFVDYLTKHIPPGTQMEMFK